MSLSAICGIQSLASPNENVFRLEVGLTGKLYGEVFGGKLEAYQLVSVFFSCEKDIICSLKKS